MTTMVDAKMHWPKTIPAKVATPAFAMAFAAIAFVTTALALGAGTANAAAHSGDPSDLAERNVAAMISPDAAIRQMSTAVTGVLAAPAGGPLAGHELHFQGRLSGDVHTVRTRANGAFSTTLPQGVYDLRGMDGAVIVRAVTVGQSPVDLGQVHPPGPYNLWRLIEGQEIGEAIIDSPAPVAAYVPSPGEAPQPIAVTPIASPKVMGAGPNGQPLAPAVVVPAQVRAQTEIPPDAQAPPPGTPPAQDLAPAPGTNAGGY